MCEVFGCCFSLSYLSGCKYFVSGVPGGGGTHKADGGAVPVVVPACLVHLAHRYGVSGLPIDASAQGVYCAGGDAGVVLPAVVCCISCC